MKSIKSLLFIFFLTTSMGALRAQYVAIPDSSFGNWINRFYSGCLTGSAASGWRLDTTCTGILTAQTIDCSHSTISDITGIRYFKLLTDLNCSYNNITSIPALPDTLFRLNCSYNQLTSLPVLPRGLSDLQCSHNVITSLPVLPPRLTLLVCNNNKLTVLPTIPSTMQWLTCNSNNQLNCLPHLPSSLQVFNFYATGITCLPNYLTAGASNPNVNTLQVCTSSSPCYIAPAATEDVFDAATIRLYPNPNGGSFVLETTNAAGSEYQVYDMVGSLIAQGAITSNHQQIHMTDVAAGVYTLQVRREASIKQLRLVIEK